MIAAVIFDLDGVISDTEPLHVRTERAVLAPLGVTPADGGLADGKGLSDAAFFRRVFAQHGIAADLATVIAAKRRAMLACPPADIAAVPGALALIDALAARGLALAVASSSPVAFVRHVLGALGVADRFRCVVSGDEVPSGKPAPDVFLLAAERLGVSPAACVVIEDSENGMRAARAAGMRCVGLVPDADRRRYPADVLVTTLTGLTAARLAAL